MKRSAQLRLSLRRKPMPRRGRPPGKGKRPVPHRARVQFVRALPVHVRLRVRKDIPRLRTGRLAEAVRRALIGGKRKPGFRICQFSLQSNHVHLICEASHHDALARGMQGFCIRFAKQINRKLKRRGSVLLERYAMTLLKVPKQVRNVICYVLHNSRRHGSNVTGADVFSSARYFDGWIRPTGLPPPPSKSDLWPVAQARTKLLTTRWRFCGRIDPAEIPPAARQVASTRS